MKKNAMKKKNRTRKEQRPILHSVKQHEEQHYEEQKQNKKKIKGKFFIVFKNRTNKVKYTEIL